MLALAERNILAEVAGYGSTCEAFHRVRLQECGEEPARAIQMAMDDAGIGAKMCTTSPCMGRPRNSTTASRPRR